MANPRELGRTCAGCFPAEKQFNPTFYLLPAEMQWEPACDRVDRRPYCARRPSYRSISPVRALKQLQALDFHDTHVADLSPLNGMHLTSLSFFGTKVSDLSPLKGMPLTRLEISYSPVASVAPLSGMPLTWLHCVNTRIVDLSPLEGMQITDLAFTPKQISKGIDVIRQMKSIRYIGICLYDDEPCTGYTPDESSKEYDTGEFGTATAQHQKFRKEADAVKAGNNK
jgi:hypothetical protein